MENSDHISNLRDANWTLLIHGWFKNKSNKWEVKEIDIS
jgi:rhamnogalacturonyl hydrolase YesR